MDRAVTALHRRAADDPAVVPLGGGLPAPELLPRDAIATALAAVDTAGLQYGWAEGDARIRAWVARRLAARGADVGPEDVIVTAGAQQAISLAARVLLEDGGVVGVGPLTYPAAIDAFRSAGATPVARRTGVDAHYAIAAAANPTGRDELGAIQAALLASRRPLIVDEAYAELRFDGRARRPLLADARDRVWHVGTVSKALSPGLRVGWLVAPRAWHDAALEQKHAADLQAGSLAQAALAALLDGFDLDAHVARVRRAYAARAEVLVDALRRHAPRAWTATDPEGGFSLWVETGEPLDDVAVLDAAIATGVSFDPGRMFRAAGAPDHGLAFRLSFSSAEPGALSHGVRRLVCAVTAAARRPSSRGVLHGVLPQVTTAGEGP